MTKIALGSPRTNAKHKSPAKPFVAEVFFIHFLISRVLVIRRLFDFKRVRVKNRFPIIISKSSSEMSRSLILKAEEPYYQFFSVQFSFCSVRRSRCQMEGWNGRRNREIAFILRMSEIPVGDVFVLQFLIRWLIPRLTSSWARRLSTKKSLQL